MFVGVIGTDPYDPFGVLGAAVLDEGGDVGGEVGEVVADCWTFGPFVHIIMTSCERRRNR